jgi:hypothetical protein
MEGVSTMIGTHRRNFSLNEFPPAMAYPDVLTATPSSQKKEPAAGEILRPAVDYI